MKPSSYKKIFHYLTRSLLSGLADRAGTATGPTETQLPHPGAEQKTTTSTTAASTAAAGATTTTPAPATAAAATAPAAAAAAATHVPQAAAEAAAAVHAVQDGVLHRGRSRWQGTFNFKITFHQAS